MKLFGHKHHNIWYSLGGAAGTLAFLSLGKLVAPIKPFLVGSMKEGYAFKEWLATKYDLTKEDLEDIAAEAKQAYEDELAEAAQDVAKEKEILAKIETIIKKRTQKTQTSKKTKK